MVCVPQDTTLDREYVCASSLLERLRLFSCRGELKEAFKNGEDLDRFRLQNREALAARWHQHPSSLAAVSVTQAAVYTIFMEDSTRTKESFRNAAEFHGLKVNVFDAKTSSFQPPGSFARPTRGFCLN